MNKIYLVKYCFDVEGGLEDAISQEGAGRKTYFLHKLLSWQRKIKVLEWPYLKERGEKMRR